MIKPANRVIIKSIVALFLLGITSTWVQAGSSKGRDTLTVCTKPPYQTEACENFIIVSKGGPNPVITIKWTNPATGPCDITVCVDPSDHAEVKELAESTVSKRVEIDLKSGAFDSNTKVTVTRKATKKVSADKWVVQLLPVQINAYRPQMVPNSVDLTPTDPTKLIIPQSEIQSSGVHIRVNGDNENSNLVEVTFSFPALATMSGLTVTVQRSGSNLNVWTTSGKGAAIIGTGTDQDNLTLDSTGNATIWVEALAQGGNDLTFLLTSDTGTTICTLGKLHFVNYDSMAMAFSGETFFSGNPLTDGMFSVSQNLYLEGYNIAYYDVHTINSSSSQPAYSEISNQISSGFVTNVGVFGYSHGGGETYNTCNLLSGTAATISFAGYVDAIEYAPPSGTTDFFRQTNYPPGASYMWNYYQTNSHLHSGPVTGANVNVNVTDTSWGASLTHAGSTAIMRSPNVQSALQGAVETYVPKY